jgi:hypothetical protein
VELVDTLASGASARKGVEVQVLFSAPAGVYIIQLSTRKITSFYQQARLQPAQLFYICSTLA